MSKKRHHKLAIFRSGFCALLALGAAAHLGAGLMSGEFNHVRYWGTVNFAAAPAKFVFAAVVDLLGIVATAAGTVIFAKQVSERT